MAYISNPNLPQGKVKLAVIDGRAKNVGMALEKMGIDVIYTVRHPILYNAVSYHPDMILHHLGGEDIVVAPDVDKNFLWQLEGYGFNIIKGETPLYRNYPGDIAYNVARIGDVAFHNIRYTDKVLLNELKKRGVKLIDIKQGYAKCSICIVNEKAIITQDVGIANKAREHGIEVLLVPPGNIKLYELNYGFIGGATGLISKSELAVAGNIQFYKYKDEILDYLDNNGISVVNLVCDEITDIGSIIPLMEWP